jgi:hypothetical protein
MEKCRSMNRAACYKRAEEVVRAVVDAGLATIEHTLWPLASLKGTDEGRGAKRARRKQDRSRDKARDAGRKTKAHY